MAKEAVRGLTYRSLPSSSETALAVLIEPVRRWFQSRFGEPTLAQRLAWPALAHGENLLLCAPTGSGKTLAAFLPILGTLLTGPMVCGTRCLYVAPLKALVNDARKNLRATLQGIRSFIPTGWGRLTVGLRTGDTSARLRQRMRQQPPDILLTTPESLAVLLSQPAAVESLTSLRWVIVDEVHALASNKRGADLSLSLERLEALTGEGLQRLGLSATCAPLAEAAHFLVGAGRSCTITQVEERSPLQLTIEPLEDAGGFMNRLVERLEPELLANATTLIFTNVRSLAERLAWALRRRFPEWDEQIAVHHSSVAAARRRWVERRLKRARLRAVVSSTSLELGIDVGSVDGVILVHPPGGVVQLLQRVGRSGHGPGRPRRGLVLTASPAELLEATVTAASSRSAQCESLRVPRFPLDVLCQQLLGMAAQRRWSLDEAFALVRRAFPFQELARTDFDDCLDYLSGRRGGDPNWLPARLRWRDGEFLILDHRTARLLLQNLGTIIAEEPRSVLVGSRPEDRGPRSTTDEDRAQWHLVGHVEEAFADRLQAGDRFLLAGRCLEFRRSEGQALLVDEVAGRPAVPRWTGEGWPLSAELARRLYLLRIQAAEALRDGQEHLVQLLKRDYALEGTAAETLTQYFQRQECLSEIPDTRLCLVEVVRGEAGAEYYLHTPLNRLGNDALARVVVRRLVRDRGRAVTSLVADLGFALFLRGPKELSAADLSTLLAVQGFEDDLAEAIAGSLTLRERFRRVALTGLMLLRNPLGRQRRVGGHDWGERRLFTQVTALAPEFVLLRQAKREVHEDCCDAHAARDFLEQLARQGLQLRRLAAVSPFAESWTQAAIGPVETPETPSEALRRLHASMFPGNEP